MNDIVNLITNYGMSVICVAYMIYFQNTTMREMLITLQAITTRLDRIELKIDEGGVKHG